MEIEELQKKKVEIENKIKEMLVELESESKGFISWVDMERMNDEQYYQNKTDDRGAIKKVRVELRIVDTKVM